MPMGMPSPWACVNLQLIDVPSYSIGFFLDSDFVFSGRGPVYQWGSIGIYIYICMDMFIYIYMHTYDMWVYIYMWMYEYIYIYIYMSEVWVEGLRQHPQMGNRFVSFRFVRACGARFSYPMSAQSNKWSVAALSLSCCASACIFYLLGLHLSSFGASLFLPRVLQESS